MELKKKKNLQQPVVLMAAAERPKKNACMGPKHKFIVIACLEGPLSHKGPKGTAEEEIRLY